MRNNEKTLQAYVTELKAKEAATEYLRGLRLHELITDRIIQEAAKKFNSTVMTQLISLPYLAEVSWNHSGTYKKPIVPEVELTAKERTEGVHSNLQESRLERAWC